MLLCDTMLNFAGSAPNQAKIKEDEKRLISIPSIPAFVVILVIVSIILVAAGSTVSTLLPRRRGWGGRWRSLIRLCVPLLGLAQPLLLPLPVSTFLVVLADLEGTAEPGILLDLGVRKFVHLMHLEILPPSWARRWRTTPVSRPVIVVVRALHLVEELLAQRVALGVYLVLVHPVISLAY